MEIEYTPFILRRHLPKEGVDKHEVCEPHLPRFLLNIALPASEHSQLNSQLHFPLRGQLPSTEVFVRQFGSAERADAVMAGVKNAAAADGLCFDLRGQRAGNSEDAHRLLLWARAHG